MATKFTGRERVGAEGSSEVAEAEEAPLEPLEAQEQGRGGKGPMKAGFKTTEFWVTTITSVLGLLNQSGALGEPISTGGLVGIAIGAAAYAISRGLAKWGN